ncbi:anti-sigma factor [Pedobacter sp. ASV28]|uniref:anti-sigma factor family protein n=1 Tax=Pedobacter sp. ASV28 TaxID=2795123 RepID=UPI0018EB92FA|nr:hypothetical protein [Pedobacter sp. ASV28]
MNIREEQLWNYIDGFCTDAEKVEVEDALNNDKELLKHYEQLLAISKQLGQLEAEEPSMSFTRNVMELVGQEMAPISLKTKVDRRIVYGIAAFFVLCLLVILCYALYTARPGFSFGMPKVHLALNLEGWFSRTALYAFLFVDLVLLLIYFDAYLRKGRDMAQKKEE